MIRWCAYCQTFQGEVAPLDSYEMTHGICEDCLRAGKANDHDAIVAARTLANLYGRLRAEARAGFDSVGISLALGNQVHGVREISASLDRWPSDVRPRLVVGGHCWKMGLTLDRGLRVETYADARRLELA